jgi:UDP-N-acetylglucosamine 4,6-dehydratase/5-epimerase
MGGVPMLADEFYQNKIILVTGGVGSIGRHLIRRLLAYNPNSIRVFDNNETGLFDLENELRSPKIRTFIGDVRDKERLMMAFDRVDIVFHAAALKHVPLCEFNSFDAIKTNVIGTQNVIEAAISCSVKKVINISTDKAVNPTNVMGATKLLAERLIISAAYYRGYHPTVLANVRFGNVLNSRGSVIPLFRRQISQGGPVTVTDREMTRFFMDIPAAADLIIKAGMYSQGRELFILKMPTMRIYDLAECMIEELAPSYGYSPVDIRIDVTGIRDGEKLSEELMTEDESRHAYENEEMYVILPHHYFEEDRQITVPPGFTKIVPRSYSSNNASFATREEIKQVIRKTD